MPNSKTEGRDEHFFKEIMGIAGQRQTHSFDAISGWESRGKKISEYLTKSCTNTSVFKKIF